MSTHTSSSSCLLCGCQCKQSTFATKANDNDFDSISDEIERLDMAIHRLRMLKAQRCRQLNTIQSTTKILPDEILLSIFLSFCSLFENRDFSQFILGGVCNHWRNLINSAPLFWKAIDLQMRNLQNLQKAESLLETFKGRNGASFEFIQIGFERLYDDTHPPVQRLLQSIKEVSASQRIVLVRPPNGLLRIVNNLDICWVSLRYLPNIMALESIPGFSFPWSSLTTLMLHQVAINICYDLLIGCPNLIQFSLHEPFVPTTEHVALNIHYAREIHFPHLQRLGWYHVHSEWDHNLFSFYRFPALQQLDLLGRSHIYLPTPFRKFTSFLPQSCTLQFSAPPESVFMLRKEILLQVEHPVEHLVCSYFDTSSISVALEQLQNSTFIPSLTSFRWEDHYRYLIEEDGVLELTQLFGDALRSRKKAGVGKFKMEIGGITLRDDFEQCDRKGVYKLMEADWFDFEIGEDGQWIMSF